MSFSQAFHALAAQISSSRIWRYGAAVLLVLAALLLRLTLNFILGPKAPYLPFALAVMIAARIGGRGPGFLATVLSAAGVTWFFLGGLHSPDASDAHDLAGLAFFVVIGWIISIFVGDLGSALQSTAEAREALRRQVQLVELAHDAIITTDASRRIVTWNAGAAETYGWRKADASGQVLHELLRTTDHPPLARMDDILRRDGRWEGELNHIAQDGRHISVESRQVLLRDENNRPAGILEINRDITERTLADARLRESESFYRQTLESIPGMVFTTRPDGYCDYQSQQWVDYTGVPMSEHLGDGWNKLLHPDDRQRAFAAWRAAVEERAAYNLEYRVRRHDGVYEWFKIIGNPIRDDSGQIARWFGVALNIEALHRAQEATRNALEQQKLAMEAADLGAWDYHPDTGEVFWDERSRRIFGVADDQPISLKDVMRLIHQEDRANVDEGMRTALKGVSNEAYHREFRVLWSNGALRWVAGHGRVLFEGAGAERRAIRFIGVNLDITERRAAEARMREEQKLESIGLLAGGVAHDFNNLLTIIIGNTSLALAQCPSCPQSLAVLEAARRASYLTKQLLAYAGKGQVVIEVMDLSDRVTRSAELLRASVPKRVELSLNLANNLSCIEEDPSRVDQILMNLVINASEAIPARTDGRIDVSTSGCYVSPDMARERSRGYEVEPGRFVCLEVRDTGVGMDEATSARIFDPFFSTKFTGRGLGLAAVYGIIRSAKGFVDLESSPGTGTTFRVYFPVTDKQPARAADAVASVTRQRPHEAKVVLVVDDEEMIRTLAAVILAHHGYQVLEAKNGQEAIRVLAEAPVLPAAVLLDLAMPIMGGDEVVPILATEYPGLKVVLTSGYPEEQARQGFRSEAVAGFLQKPYSATSMMDKIHEVLGVGATQS